MKTMYDPFPGIVYYWSDYGPNGVGFGYSRVFNFLRASVSVLQRFQTEYANVRNSKDMDKFLDSLRYETPEELL